MGLVKAQLKGQSLLMVLLMTKCRERPSRWRQAVKRRKRWKTPASLPSLCCSSQGKVTCASEKEQYMGTKRSALRISQTACFLESLLGNLVRRLVLHGLKLYIVQDAEKTRQPSVSSLKIYQLTFVNVPHILCTAENIIYYSRKYKLKKMSCLSHYVSCLK